MTVPDKLIEAVAQALHDADPGWNTTSARREIATVAVKATLTALRECREAYVVAADILEHWSGDPDDRLVAARILDALAKELGGASDEMPGLRHH